MPERIPEAALQTPQPDTGAGVRAVPASVAERGPLPLRGGRARSPPAPPRAALHRTPRGGTARPAGGTPRGGGPGRHGLGGRCGPEAGAAHPPTGPGIPLLPQTSTKASVKSLARSITGKWRPATILTFSFPGIFLLRLPPAAGRKQPRASHGTARPSRGGGRSGRACVTPSNGLSPPAHARRRRPHPAPQRPRARAR